VTIGFIIAVVVAIAAALGFVVWASIRDGRND